MLNISLVYAVLVKAGEGNDRIQRMEAPRRWLRRWWSDHLSTPLVRYMQRQSDQLSNARIYYVTVDPQVVKHSTALPTNRLPAVGREAVYGPIGGPWDFLKLPFTSHSVYREMATTFEGLHGSDADDIAKAASATGTQGGGNEELVHRIATVGYKPQRRLAAEGHLTKRRRIGPYAIPDEVILAATRRGELLQFRGGRHRLAAAQLAGIEEIPAILSVYHPNADYMTIGGIHDIEPLGTEAHQGVASRR